MVPNPPVRSVDLLGRDGEPTELQCRSLFGDAWDAIVRFADLLVRHGEERGLLGPSECGRLWSRHLVNSAAVVPFLSETESVIDIGSGAGLPGIVLAAMRPRLAVELMEPMARRTDWLTEAAEALGLQNVTVTRGRAEDFAGARVADVVTARAVASLSKLAGWSAGLLSDDGRLVALKGRQACEEVKKAGPALRSAKLGEVAVHEMVPVAGMEPTFVVVAGRHS